MAILANKVLNNLRKMLREADIKRSEVFLWDPIVQIGASCHLNNEMLGYPSQLNDKVKHEMSLTYRDEGIVGIIKRFYSDGILNLSVNGKREREVLVLKTAFTSLPATTCRTILEGFGNSLEESIILQIYASHGLSRQMKPFNVKYNFRDINRFAIDLESIITVNDKNRTTVVNDRFEAMINYLSAKKGKREQSLRKNKLNRSLFFHYWKRFSRYGFLGLCDKGKEVFRQGKIGFANEGKIIIDSLQYPERSNSFYVERLKSKGILIERSNISRMFSKWNTKKFQSCFVDDLKRLSSEPELKNRIVQKPLDHLKTRYVDEHFISLLSGMNEHCLHTDAPGLFVILAYLEKLKIFPLLEKMGLTYIEKGYSWSDLFLFNIGRIFYGISSYTDACEHQEPSLAFFSGLLKAPSNDSFLNGLESKISEKEVYSLRTHLVKQAVEHHLIEGKNIAFDFHQIDLDVIFGRLRKIGKGPSPKKKICYNGFRPHISWDLSTNCLIVNEFRKSSARGTTTTKPYIEDYLLSEFKDVFENVYVDSEYTGKDLWSFIIDDTSGCGADLTACLKQNIFVRKARDIFIHKHINDNDFWIYYDDEHVVSRLTFKLNWEKKIKKVNKRFELNCVVKKKLKNGNLRCFGSSKKQLSSLDILNNYSERWLVENGIKDLVISYFMNQCPGTKPHLIDIHFLIITICRYVYKMIEADLGTDIINNDGSIKTLDTMRKSLFRQGAGQIRFKDNTFKIDFLNSYSVEMTNMLKRFYSKIEDEFIDGLSILGGNKLNFKLRVPYGKEFKNSFKKSKFSANENF